MLSPRARATLWRALASAVLSLATLAPVVKSEDFQVRPLRTGPTFVGYVPDEFVVVFRPETAHRLRALTDTPGRGRANLPEVQSLLDAVGARGFEKEFEGSEVPPAGGPYPDMTSFYVVKLPAGSDVDAAMNVFASHPDVGKVQKDAIHTIDVRPNDKRYIWTPLPQPAGYPDRQWQYMGQYGIDAEPAWNLETGDPNVIVAILDTGVKYRHADLGGPDPPGPADNVTNGNIWVNPGEIPGNGIDDDGSGKIDDVVGWDFVDDATNFAGASCQDVDCGIVDNDPNDGEGHGTHLAGTVAGITNNDDVQNPLNPAARGIAGVVGGFSDGTATGAGNGCKIMPLRIGVRVRYQGVYTGVVLMRWAAQAMYYVAKMKEKGFNIASINCSWGSSSDTSLTNAVANLVAHDVVICNAAGNDGINQAPYLATLPGVVAVGATDSTGVAATFSNYGSWVDIGAPGVLIISTSHDPAAVDTTISYIAAESGTSMASPHVAAVAALLESYNPSLTAAQKVDLMVNHTKAFGPGNTRAVGLGILDANLALLAAPSPVGVAVGPLATGRPLQLSALPNPVRAGTDLVIRAGAGEKVTLSILDAGGRRMRTLEGAADAAGTLRIRWDGHSASGLRARSGLYLVHAVTPSGEATQKLVVLD
jgi:subtilisin family serine protease